MSLCVYIYMYLNCKHEVRECDRYVMFDLDLSNSASDFKTIYEERFPHALVSCPCVGSMAE